MEPYLRELLKTLVRTASFFLAIVAAVAYLVCTLINDQNPYSKRLWIVSASAGLIAIAFDWLSRRFDEREAKSLRTQLDLTKQITVNLMDRHAFRTLSDPQNRAIAYGGSPMRIQPLTDSHCSIHRFAA
jgi:hypothetical protein